MKKTERLFIRVTPDQKERIMNDAKTQSLTVTDYLLKCLPENTPGNSSTHEQTIENTLTENNFYNSLMTNKDLPNKAKKIISKELVKYVLYPY